MTCPHDGNTEPRPGKRSGKEGRPEPGNESGQSPGPAHIVWIASDGTGRTAVQIVRSVSYQFERELDFRVVSEVETEDAIVDLIERVDREPGLLVYTIVSESNRELLRTLAAHRGLRTVDLFEPLISQLQQWLRMEPLEIPGLSQLRNADYFRMIDAVDFTVKHDDGRMLETIGESDLVLTGPSRAGKTPLALYLANLGWKVANVPLTGPDFQPPPELDKLEQVFCILTEPNLLQRRRRERVRRLGDPLIRGYSDIGSIRREIEACREAARSRGWTVIDVSYRPVEDTAHRVLEKAGYS